MKEIYKILNDTLKGPSGKYSRKSLTMFISFGVSILLGSYIVFANYITEIPVNEYAIDVFYGFLMLAGGTSVVTVWDKFKNRDNGSNNVTENTDSPPQD